MRILLDGKLYKFNKHRLLNNAKILLLIILFIVSIGLAGASDVASGIY